MSGDEERVGVLFVHGIGEQKTFEHLEGETRNLIRALRAVPCVRQVSVDIRTAGVAARLGTQETWSVQDCAPVTLVIEKEHGSRLLIDLHEVWWADLDERASFWGQLRFWLWGLSQWAERAGLRQSLHPSDKLPKAPFQHSGFRVRAQLFLVGVVFFLSFAVLMLMRLLKIRFFPQPEILANYLGDVKLMVQQERESSGPLDEGDVPPRVSIRRRIIRKLLDMERQEYDRWYILAHSLGSVVAENGLVETGRCLPNYLDRKRLAAARSRLIVKAPNTKGTMLPPRPVWLNGGEEVDRSKLFAKLRGVLTYGCPLDKFATLWPWIVPVNQEAVFTDCRWVNIYDETDPVSGNLDCFGNPGDRKTALSGETSLVPENVAVNASPVLLLSHIRYLAFKLGDPSRPVNHVAQWIVGGDTSGLIAELRKTTGVENPDKPRRSRLALRYGQWVLVQILLAVGVGWIISYLLSATAGIGQETAAASSWATFFDRLAGGPTSLPDVVWLWFVGTAVAVVAVLVAGVANWMWPRPKD